MATEQASMSTSRDIEVSHSRTWARQLWQVPIFWLGVLAIAGVWAARPHWQDAQGRQVERDLEEIRQALDQQRPDVDEMLGRAQRALDGIDRFPARTGEAHFLRGSCFVRLAVTATGDEAVHAWQQARLHLEEAERIGASTSDFMKLAFRLGKTYAALNVRPDKVITYLQRAGDEGADDPAERYALLAEAYLKLPTPDLPAALECTQKQLALPAADDATLAPARLRCGELLLRLQRRDEAHQVLARIKHGAPPSVRFRANYLQARSYQEEGNWKEAARMWEEVKESPEAAGERGRILYQLGLCYRKDGRSAEAQGAWEAAAPQDAETKQAALLSRADLRARGDNPVAAIDMFDSALKDVQTPTDYRNSLVSLVEVRAFVEAACHALRAGGDPEHFEHLAKVYARIAEPQAGQQLLGEAAEAAARNLLEQARKAASSDEARRLDEAAREHFQRAAQAYETVSKITHGQQDEPDWLWRSADAYYQDQDYQNALILLEQYVKHKVSAEKLGEAWFLTAEAHRALNHGAAALAAYQLCIAYPSPFAYAARYQLALADLQRGQRDRAAEGLEHILKLLGPAQDNEIREKTLFTLGELLFRRGNWAAAQRRLQEALERYPANPSARQARLRLAFSCWRLALDVGQRNGSELSTQETRSDDDKLRQKWLEQAAVNYQKLADDLTARQATTSLTGEDESLLRQAAFAAAERRFDLGQYDEAIRLYDALAERYRLRVEGLMALRFLWRCYWVKAQTVDQDKAQYEAAARATYDRISAALREMPSTAFDNSEDRTRESWLQWLAKNGR